MGSKALVAKAVTKSFARQGAQEQVLRGVDATFEYGHTYAIMGVSGVGKSTLMHILAGLDTPTTGTVSFDGKDLAELSAEKQQTFHNKQVGVVFQFSYLIRELSVLENVMLPGLIAGKTADACHKWAEELLEHVGLEGRGADQVGVLSGGQQQRVAFARALFNKPAIVFADEPTGNLDVKTGRAIMTQLLEWQKEWGMTLIVSTHDTQVARMMDTIYHVQDGVLKLG